MWDNSTTKCYFLLPKLDTYVKVNAGVIGIISIKSHDDIIVKSVIDIQMETNRLFLNSASNK